MIIHSLWSSQKKEKKIKIFAYISFPSFLSPGMIGIFQPDH